MNNNKAKGDIILQDKKEFTKLEFYIWSIRYLPAEKWVDEILLDGTDSTMKIMAESLQYMLESSKNYKKGTRKFKCNPPKDFDVIKYAKEKKAEFKWFDWLVVKIDLDSHNDTKYEIKDNKVIIEYNEKTLKMFIDCIWGYSNQDNRYSHGSKAPGKFYFSPDWLGIE